LTEILQIFIDFATNGIHSEHSESESNVQCNLAIAFCLSSFYKERDNLGWTGYFRISSW